MKDLLLARKEIYWKARFSSGKSTIIAGNKEKMQVDLH